MEFTSKFLCCLLSDKPQTWYTSSWVDRLLLCQRPTSSTESHLSYTSLKRSSRTAYFSPRISPPVSNFVLHLGIGPKWSRTKFGLKPLKPGVPKVPKVFSSICACAIGNALFWLRWRRCIALSYYCCCDDNITRRRMNCKVTGGICRC